MFETSRPQTSARGRRLFYEMLPVSLTFHALIAGALLIVNVWKVEFPSQSPKHYLAFQLADAPPPPPPPPPPAARPQAVAQPVVKPPDEIVAPSVIPDAIPVVANEIVPQVEAPGAVEGGVEGGIEGGEIGGMIGGVIGSVVTPQPQTPPPPPAPPADGRIYIERDAPLHLPILSQAYPMYPSEAATRGWEDQLVIRYVIGKDGRVKEVTIVSPPARKQFEQPTLRAIRMWRFRPFVKDGQKFEVVHELTVNYRLTGNG
jgi:protein TonB